MKHRIKEGHYIYCKICDSASFLWIRRHADRTVDTRTQHLVLLYETRKAASYSNVLLATKYIFLHINLKVIHKSIVSFNFAIALLQKSIKYYNLLVLRYSGLYYTVDLRH
jgi:hypothetical protein